MAWKISAPWRNKQAAKDHPAIQFVVTAPNGSTRRINLKRNDNAALFDFMSENIASAEEEAA